MSMRSRQTPSSDALEANDLEFEIHPSAERADAAQDEAEEMEVAAQLLEITNESELDQFIGDLLKKAARGIRAVIPSSVQRPLALTLKGVLKRALPVVGGASQAILTGSEGGVSGHGRTEAADAFG